MKTEINYQCPTCLSIWNTEDKANKCKMEHKIIKIKTYICEICGTKFGANNDNFSLITDVGLKLLAENCEKSHSVKKNNDCEHLNLSYIIDLGLYCCDDCGKILSYEKLKK